MTSMFLVIHHAIFHCIPHMCSHLPQAKINMLLHSINSSRQRQHQNHTSEVTRDLNLIDHSYFIRERNQREKKISNTVEIMELCINNHFYSSKQRKKDYFFFISLQMSVYPNRTPSYCQCLLASRILVTN